MRLVSSYTPPLKLGCLCLRSSSKSEQPKTLPQQLPSLIRSRLLWSRNRGLITVEAPDVRDVVEGNTHGNLQLRCLSYSLVESCPLSHAKLMAFTVAPKATSTNYQRRHPRTITLVCAELGTPSYSLQIRIFIASPKNGPQMNKMTGPSSLVLA